MLPVIALVGRPNVGKSTLFNRLTRSRDALVADQPGLTRDRQYGVGRLGSRPYVVVDTGGISGDREGVDVLMAQQVRYAIGEADLIFFMLDGREGLTAGDIAIATSGDYRNYFEHDGERYTHTIDPKSGRPIRHRERRR
mgnify:CR=1 FL=1